ncbi:MAG TPA: 3-isopropylmalate dehydratase [Rhodospirillaceae bacterium]|nr:3-isopropylmalate dehydratase [Rhodospirillaceae bacterium]HAA93981.1 3-isopropylmalate dehydratase [Rhodospirillaceae bacterium]HAT35427.1 3-isopropylmalate dehydratase [Rhodospirillaceae bacterium]|tara:strand:+ start:57 stop:566 length:510 start_codon:yes stop_codon:yes gene_type:complete
MESKIVRARVWKFPENVNTDQIIPNRAYYFTPEEQLPYIFDAMRPGWVDEMDKGDIIVSERNFGMGSSRPAARNLALLGVGCLVSESINGLFYRNSVNFGLPALECPGVAELFDEGQTAEVSFEDFSVKNLDTGESLGARSVPDSLLRVLMAGGLYPLLEAESLLAPAS